MLDKLYRPKFMEMDGTYNYNIEIPLTFTYSVEPKSICNVNEYNREGQLVKTSDCFKDPLEACVVASGLNRELISHLTFHSY